MQIVFSSVGAYGHMFPLIPLAIAAREAGHQVAFATHERFHPALGEAGLEAIAAGGTVREAIGQAFAELPPDQAPEAAPSAFGRILPQRMVADLAPVLEARKPDLVVYEALNPGASIAASVNGIPAVCHGVGRLSGGANWQAMSDTWTVTAKEFGVATSEGTAFFGNPYLDICPPSLRLAEAVAIADRMDLRPVSWNRPAPLPSRVAAREAGRPLVYLTLGTAFGNAQVLRDLITALSGLPIELIVAAGPMARPEEIGDVPGHVSVEEWVPQRDVLRHVDLVVSHGGSGTTLDALANGLPHLIIPQGADQFGNAQMVSAAGAGRRVMPREFSGEAVAEHARALLGDEEVRARAAELAQEIAAMPSPAETVDRLVTLVG